MPTSDRNLLPIIATVLTLLGSVVGGALAFRTTILTELQQTVATELKHTVTREELMDFRRQQADQEHRWRLEVIRRLDAIEFQLKTLAKGR